MMKFLILVCILALNTVNAQTPLTNTFTYQGELKFNNALANGLFDFKFSVFDVQTDGSVLETVTVTGVTVTNGVFTTPITLMNDLFTGNKIWLDIEVKTNGTVDPFDPLSPRQEVTSSPYAIHAQFVGADAVTGVQIANGTITASDVNTGSVQSRVSGVCALGRYMQSVNSDGTINCAGNAIGVSEGVGIGTAITNGYQLNVLGSSYLRNDLDTSTAADLVLGGRIGNATDDGVLSSDLTIGGSDLFIKSNDAVLITVDANNDGDSGRFEVRSTSGGKLLEVQEAGVVKIPGSLDVTGSISVGSITLPNDSVSSNQLAASSVNRSEISGAEVMLYIQNDFCVSGRSIVTYSTCQTTFCDISNSLYFQCGSNTCGVPIRPTCTNIAIGYLLSPQLGL